MKRRDLLVRFGLFMNAMAMGNTIAVASTLSSNGKKKKRLLRIAHITDVHIRPEHNAPERFRKCIAEIRQHKVDFFLNGGDTIYAADYAHITRDRVNEQWAIWNSLRNEFSGYEIFSCLGNHDMWWAAPDINDTMYGKEYVVKQLGIPHRYYSFDRKGWHFVVLDSNNKNAGSLDDEQRKWLEADLAGLPEGTPVICMTHYPIMGLCTLIDGGNHTDSAYISDLFYRHSDKKIHCLSGHIHLKDAGQYNGVQYFCNGALSGFWWEDGDKQSAGRYYYRQTPPGYTIIDLYEDGSITNEYIPHSY